MSSTMPVLLLCSRLLWILCVTTPISADTDNMLLISCIPITMPLCVCLQVWCQSTGWMWELVRCSASTSSSPSRVWLSPFQWSCQDGWVRERNYSEIIINWFCSVLSFMWMKNLFKAMQRGYILFCQTKTAKSNEWNENVCVVSWFAVRHIPGGYLPHDSRNRACAVRHWMAERHQQR